MKPFFITVAVGLIAVASMVYSIDPGGYWHRQMVPAHPLQRGETWNWPGPNIDQLKAKIQMAKITPTADVVIMGSSRVLNPDFISFSPSVRRLNLGVGYATPERFKALWEALRDTGHSPRYLIWAPDPWQFRSSWVRQYSIDQRKRSRVGAHLHEMLNITSFKASIKWMFQSHVPVHRYRWDGTLEKIPQSTDLAPTDNQVIPLQPDVWVYLANLITPWDVQRKDAEWAYALMDEWQRQGVQVMIVGLPFRPDSYASLMKHEPSKKAINGYLAILKELAASHPNARFCDGFDFVATGCLQQDFVDTNHLGDAGMDKIIRTCLKKDIEWRKLLKD